MNQLLAMMKEHGLDQQHEESQAELRAAYDEYVQRVQNAAGQT
jgi:uncharacterized protein YnzC (UPF0291/DUF896 family)